MKRSPYCYASLVCKLSFILGQNWHSEKKAPGVSVSSNSAIEGEIPIGVRRARERPNLPLNDVSSVNDGAGPSFEVPVAVRERRATSLQPGLPMG